MLLAGLTFLPAILAIFGRAVFWPSNVSKVDDERPGLWGRVGTWAVKRPLATLITLLAFFIVLALGLVNSGTSGFADLTAGPTGTDSAAGQAVIVKHYPEATTGIAATSILFKFQQPIWSHIGTLDAIQRELSAVPAFAKVSGPLAPNGIPLGSAELSRLYRTLGPPRSLPRVEPANVHVPPMIYGAYHSTFFYISPDGRTVQWSTLLKANNTSSSHDLSKVPALRDAITAIAHRVGADDSGVFGQIAFSYDVSALATNDLHTIIPVVAVIIAILLAIVLRSLIAPLYLVPSVILSYLAALGLAAYIFVHFGNDTGLNFVLPFLMFIFLTALGSDYNILVMTRIREEARKRPLRQAVSYAVGASGTTITTAGMILAGTFAVLGATAGNQAGADQLRQIGFGIAAGILMDTFLIRTLLIPAIVTMLGRWNWWPSALYRKSIDEEPEPEQGVA
jgi:RND superfamily putative drug exporter